MEIQEIQEDFLEKFFISDEDDQSFYYFLIDSTNFLGVDSFLDDFNFEGGEYINLYADFSKNLQENGAILYSFTKEECLKNLDKFRKIISFGCLNFFNSNYQIQQVQDHLEDLMEIKQPNGKSALFRFQDNFALHATISNVNVLKLKKILSFKINYWIWQNADNKFYKLENKSNNREKLKTLIFLEEEFYKINLDLKPLRLMPILKEFDEDLKQLKFYEVYNISIKLLNEAKLYNLFNFEDEILFSNLYYQFGELMFSDGPIKKALEKTQMTGKSFQNTTDEIDLIELDSWYERIQLQKLQNTV